MLANITGLVAGELQSKHLKVAHLPLYLKADLTPRPTYA